MKYYNYKLNKMAFTVVSQSWWFNQYVVEILVTSEYSSETHSSVFHIHFRPLTLPLQQQELVWHWHAILWCLRYFLCHFDSRSPLFITDFSKMINTLCAVVRRHLAVRTCCGSEWSFSGASSSCCCSACPAGVYSLMPRPSCYIWARTPRWPGN